MLDIYRELHSFQLKNHRKYYEEFVFWVLVCSKEIFFVLVFHQHDSLFHEMILRLLENYFYPLLILVDVPYYHDGLIRIVLNRPMQCYLDKIQLVELMKEQYLLFHSQLMDVFSFQLNLSVITKEMRIFFYEENVITHDN